MNELPAYQNGFLKNLRALYGKEALFTIELDGKALRNVRGDIVTLVDQHPVISCRFNALQTFVYKEGVEPTNNLAEITEAWFDLEKASYGNQSEKGEKFVERIMTVNC